ncbi:MAG: sulfite exporter TauE/SafE family protein, partial [Candidatus Cloacimonadota bacterium]|nr:sulfite exporter TauE/SafE family protein [Candidatus Cloacimonadota bacterium]
KILAVVFLIILPVIFLPKPQIENRRLPKWLECLIFFFIGIYGGMIQVGVGFILLASLNLVENFNLIKANAAKVFIIFCYTVIAVGLFAFSSKIIWVYGIILALGNATGGYLGVLIAVKGGEKIIKIILTLAILTTFLKLVGIIQLPSF